MFFRVHFPNDPPPGFWHPTLWPPLRGPALSVYQRGRRLSVYKRGSRARGKKADKLLNEEANYPGHHTSSCQQATFGQSGSETSGLCCHLDSPMRQPSRYPLAQSHRLASIFPHKRPASQRHGVPKAEGPPKKSRPGAALTSDSNSYRLIWS